MKNLVIVGYGRSGKDTAALWLHNNTLHNYVGSTSWAALPLVADFLRMPQQVAWDTRHEGDNRKQWKTYCKWLKRDNPLLLVQILTRKKATVITGLRDLNEVQMAKERGFHIVWVDAEKRGVVADETVDPGIKELADEVWDNNGSEFDLYQNLNLWASNLGIALKGP